ncbi:TPA: DUF3883 domain-containing protein [Candidatus Scatousia excrementigallinarum]|uniref:DUF3883 domain-containing protein n=1 Tax=Candidatus Scatousia excrementigallinarum TaxID=2840935 RepID=A0A9D1JMB5_9BACT|nr:DUF3883 domain-containing protein [Candidatus Scatousia excrementigallinarum]
MKYENKLALITAYYLSKYDDLAYKKLNYGSKNSTHKKIGLILGVNPNTVKNMRDAFDPLHDNPRVGWYQRELPRSRSKVVEMFGDLSEESLYEIVREILFDKELNNQDDFKFALGNIKESDKTLKKSYSYTTRGITGKKAEEYFLKNYKKIINDVNAELLDKRADGLGYDFIIKSLGENLYYEIKGLNTQTGGILMTEKEWAAAKNYKERYFLCLFKNFAQNTVEEIIINNPAVKLNPRKLIKPVIQVNWYVQAKDLIGK